jgi:predicted RND superfamily exporter protein
MANMDEKILEFINEREDAEEPRNICEEPVKVGNRYYEFEETEFFHGKLKLYIPKDFEDMSQNLREIKYPSSQRPQIIKTDETGSVNITLNPIDNDLEEQWVKELTDGMKMIIKKTNPANVFFTDGIEANSLRSLKPSRVVNKLLTICFSQLQN